MCRCTSTLEHKTPLGAWQRMLQYRCMFTYMIPCLMAHTGNHMPQGCSACMAQPGNHMPLWCSACYA